MHWQLPGYSDTNIPAVQLSCARDTRHILIMTADQRTPVLLPAYRRVLPSVGQ